MIDIINILYKYPYLENFIKDKSLFDLNQMLSEEINYNSPDRTTIFSQVKIIFENIKNALKYIYETTIKVNLNDNDGDIIIDKDSYWVYYNIVKKIFIFSFFNRKNKLGTYKIETYTVNKEYILLDITNKEKIPLYIFDINTPLSIIIMYSILEKIDYNNNLALKYFN